MRQGAGAGAGPDDTAAAAVWAFFKVTVIRCSQQSLHMNMPPSQNRLNPSVITLIMLPIQENEEI